MEVKWKEFFKPNFRCNWECVATDNDNLVHKNARSPVSLCAFACKTIVYKINTYLAVAVPRLRNRVQLTNLFVFVHCSGAKNGRETNFVCTQIASTQNDTFSLFAPH